MNPGREYSGDYEECIYCGTMRPRHLLNAVGYCADDTKWCEVQAEFRASQPITVSYKEALKHGLVIASDKDPRHNAEWQKANAAKVNAKQRERRMSVEQRKARKCARCGGPVNRNAKAKFCSTRCQTKK